jgi:hypothetical protein
MVHYFNVRIDMLIYILNRKFLFHDVGEGEQHGRRTEETNFNFDQGFSQKISFITYEYHSRISWKLLKFQFLNIWKLKLSESLKIRLFIVACESVLPHGSET